VAAGYDNGRQCEIANRPRASIVYENILRFSQDSLRSDRLSQGIFNLTRTKKIRNSPLVTHHFQVDQCARQEQWMGTEGSEGRWVRQACIGQSVILNYQVCHDKTTAANQTGGRPMCGERGGGVCRGRRDRQTCVRACLPPVPARLSHNAPPPRGGDSRGRSTDRQTYGRPGAWRRSLVAGVRLRTKTTLLQYYEHFHTVTKYINTVISNNIAVTYDVTLNLEKSRNNVVKLSRRIDRWLGLRSTP